MLLMLKIKTTTWPNYNHQSNRNNSGEATTINNSISLEDLIKVILEILMGHQVPFRGFSNSTSTKCQVDFMSHTNHQRKPKKYTEDNLQVHI